MKKRSLIIVLAILSLISCESMEDLDSPTFDVLSKDVVINAGDTLAFDFKGNADILTFYSGEFGNVYEHKGRTERPFEGNIKISFETSVQNSYAIDPFPREVDVFISSDFNGDLNYANVISESSKWEIISDRFTFPITSTNGTVKAVPITTSNPEGKLDITELVEIGKSFYIAFRYKADNKMRVGSNTRNAREWRVDALSLVNEHPEGTSVLMSQSSAGWKFVNRADNEIETGRGGSLNSTGRISIKGNQNTTESGIEIWAISNPINTGMAKTEPDRGVTIKNISRNRLESYTHVYNKPGVYKAVFVAANSNIYGHQSVVKEVNVTVNP